MIRRYFALVFVVALVAIGLLNPMQLGVKLGEGAPTLETSVQAKDLTLVCPGSVFQTGGSSGTSLKTLRLGSAAVFGGITNKSLELLGGPVSGRIISARAFTALDPKGEAIQGSALLNASQYQLVATKNMAGLAAANCMRPISDAWLVGGDSSIGRDTLLVLTNPSLVDSTVDLQILGSGGSISAPGLSSISVPAGKTTVIPVSSLAPNLATFSLHVKAVGGALGIWMQQRTIRSLQPGGVDFISPATDAAKSVLIPGIYLRGVADAEKLVALNKDYVDLRPMLRLSNSTDKDANVTAQILGANSKTFGTVVQKLVPANSTVDVTISGLDQGDYFAIVDSSEPIRASVRIARTKKTQNDFTWLQAADAFTAERAVATPSGSISKLALVNGGSVSSVVTVRIGGVTSTYTVRAKSTLSVVATPGLTSFVSASEPISANVVVDIDGMVGAVGVIDYKNLGGTVAITIR